MGVKFFYRSVDQINSVNKKIIVNNLLKKKDKVLLAFSGGQDSICLLFLLNQLYSQMELNLVLFWCHHLWQKESFSLMHHIAKLSFLFQFNCCFAIPSNFISSELLARKWRHDCSYRVSSFYDYSKICLAHTSNDKVETLFLNLMRGTGLNGLSPLRQTQFISKNSMGKKEHLSKFFSDRITPFFWVFHNVNRKNSFYLFPLNTCYESQNFFTFDSVGKIAKKVRSSNPYLEKIQEILRKFWTNDKKKKTIFVFFWEQNIFNATTNLPFFSTTCSVDDSSKGSKKSINGLPDLQSNSNTSSLWVSKALFTFYCSPIVSLPLIETSTCFPKTSLHEKKPLFRGIVWKQKSLKTKITCIPLQFTKKTLFTLEKLKSVKICSNGTSSEIFSPYVAHIFLTESHMFMISTFFLCAPTIFLNSFSLKEEYRAQKKFQLISHFYFHSYPLSTFGFSKIYFKKSIKKIIQVSQIDMCLNKKKQNIKIAKNKKAKKWFNRVSFTFFKTCSIDL